MKKSFIIQSSIVLVIAIFGFFVITLEYKSIKIDQELEDSHLAMDYAQDLINSSGDFQVIDSELYSGGISLHESEIVNYISYYTGFGCSIFQEKTRVSSTLSPDDVVGIPIGSEAPAEICKLVLEEGKEFQGISKSMGKEWLIYYKPLVGQNDTILGMVSVFKDYAVYKSAFILFSFIVGSTIFGLAGFLIVMLYAAEKKKIRLLAMQTDLMASNAGLIKERSQTALLSLVSENTQQSIIISSHHEVIIWVNKAFEETFGFTSREVIGKKVSSLITGPKTDIATIKSIDEAIFEKNIPIDVSILNYKKDRSEIWTKSYITPILDENQNLLRYVTTATDITNEKQFQDLLANSEANFRQIADTITDVFYLYNIKDKKYEFMSNSSTEAMGASPEFFYEGKKYTDKFVHSADKELLHQSNSKVDKGEAYDIEYRVVIKGETRWLRERSYPIENEKGSVIKNSGVITDITSSKIIAKKVDQNFLTNRVMAELGLMITEEMNVKKIVQFTHERLKELMDVESLAIGEINHQEKTVEFPYVIDNNEYFEKLSYSLDDNILANICINTKKDVIIKDFQNDIESYTGEKLDSTEGELPKSVVYLPIFSKQEVIGVITVQSPKRNAYTKNQVEILRSISVYVSNALTNAKSFENLEELVKERTLEVSSQKVELENSYHDFQLITQIGLDIASSVELEDVFDKIYLNVKKLVAAEVFGIRMLDNETYEVDYKYEIESGKRDESMRVSMNDKDNYTVWCIENQQEIFINDNKKEFNKYVKEIVVPAGEMPNSLIFCPIFYQENVIGVITVQSFKKNAYQERALNIIKTLSAYCGIAYSNAQRLDALAAKLKKKN